MLSAVCDNGRMVLANEGSTRSGRVVCQKRDYLRIFDRDKSFAWSIWQLNKTKLPTDNGQNNNIQPTLAKRVYVAKLVVGNLGAFNNETWDLKCLAST